MNATAIMLAFAASLLGFDDAARSDPDQLVKKAIDYRTGLRSGHVILTHVYNHYEGLGDYGKIRREYDIYFDHKNFRSVVKWYHPAWSKVTKTVVANDTFINDWWKDERVVTGPRGRADQPMYVQEAFDPRLLGLFPGGVSVLYRYAMTAPFFFSRWEHSDAIRSKLGGLETFRIDYQVTPDRRVRLWVAPDRGYGVPRLEVENGAPGQEGHILSVLSSKFSSFEKGAIWFPKEIVLSDFGDGKLVEEELIRVEEAQFNIKIDPAVFTFGGLGIEPGRKVIGQPGNRMMIWTGSQLVDEHASGRPTTDSTYPPQRSSKIRWFWWANALVFALAALAITVRSQRSPRTPH